jgi:CxxC motif-containing protein
MRSELREWEVIKMAEQVLICIGCPLGCHVTLKMSDKGEVESTAGNQCKEGKDYVVAECRAPVRVFTATVFAEGSGRLLPVRTDKPIHKNQLKEIMKALAKVSVRPPVKVGQTIIHNILGTGANLIATGNL